MPLVLVIVHSHRGTSIWDQWPEFGAAGEKAEDNYEHQIVSDFMQLVRSARINAAGEICKPL